MGGTSSDQGPPAPPPTGGPAPVAPDAALQELGAAFDHLLELLNRLGGLATYREHGPLLVDMTERIVYAPPWFDHLFGIPPAAVCGVAMADLMAWLGLRRLDGDAGTDEMTTYTLARPDGTQQVLHLRVVPLVTAEARVIGTLRAFHDATATLEAARVLAETSRELDDARARLTRAQHLKALGQLAAEVAHEFGNLLQAIGLQAAALRRHPALPDNATPALWSIKQAVDMGQALTRRLLTFARDDPHRQMEPLDVGRVLRDLVQLLEPRVRNRGDQPLRVELYVPELPPVLGDQTKLTEAFLNLFLNAFDAMPDGGTLSVSGTECGGELRITVRDTGVGMSHEDAVRAFDPFFTTKPGGTGLGLSTVYGVVREHGGSVFLESDPRQGTTVFVALPTATPPSMVAPVPPAPVVRRAGRVLVVDDHPTVRTATSELLAANGYEVESAGTAAEALTAIAARPFAVVVTDIGLPDRPGWEVARAAKQHLPRSIVVLVSGWGSHFSADEARARGVDVVFEKPVDPDVLLATIGREMRAARATCA